MEDKSDELLRVGQRKFLLILFSVVVVLSFGVGISIGLSRNNIADARASLMNPDRFDKLQPVPGMQLTSIGQGAKVRGVNAEMASFSSGSSVRDLLTNQVEIWKKNGLWTSGMATAKRGMAFALNRTTKEKYQTVAFFCPVSIRGKLCNGQNIYGVTTYVAGDTPTSDEGKDVPMCPNAKVSGSFSAYDLGRPTVTVNGICRSSLEETAEYFRSTLVGADWRQKDEIPTSFAESTSSVMIFEKEREEISIVLSQSPKTTETLAVVTKRKNL